MAERSDIGDRRAVVVFGETLVDEFPDRSVLGGAPFNVAYHLQHFGLAPLLVTRIGEDANGDRLVAAIASAGMNTRGVQRDATLPTGRVRVTFGDGGHRFEILDDQAYDAINANDAVRAVGATNDTMSAASGALRRLVYFGTLAQRSERSRAALDAVLAECNGICWCDLNLRAPFDTTDVIVRSLEAADVLKLNSDELDSVARRLGLDGSDAGAHAASLLERYRLQSVLVTCGPDGAWALDAAGTYVRVEGRPLAGPLADTVGAGDGFAAVAIVGLSRQWSLRETLERADALARAICLVHGAIPYDRTVYQTIDAP